jgi:hypothetical protein
MILWNPSAIEWQAQDAIEAARGAIREHDADPVALATVRDVESRLEQALTALDAAIREVNGLERSAGGVRHGRRARQRAA